MHIDQAGRRHTIETTLEWIAPSIQAATHSIAVRAPVPNPEKSLVAGGFATLEIVVSEESVLAVPRTAVLRFGDVSFVFVEEPESAGKAVSFRRVPVHLGTVEGSDWLKVEDGLQAGDPVVVSGVPALASLFPR